MRMDERKKQEEQLIKIAKDYFDQHGLNESFDRFFARTDVMRKIQGAYNSFERNLKSIIDNIESIDCSEEVKERAREIVKTVSGRKDVIEADIKLTMMCSMFSLFYNMEAWIEVDDQVLRPFKDMMVLEKGTKIMKTFDEMCERLVSKLLAKTLGLICESMNKDEETRLLMLMLTNNPDDPVCVDFGNGFPS